jgi:hypothetical protein
LALTEGYHKIVPSAESRQLDDVRTEAGQLRKEIAGYQLRLEDQQRQAAERDQRHLDEVKTLNAKLDPFIQAATSRYPGIDIAEALDRLGRELQEVRALASPPTLSYATHTITQTPEGYALSVQLGLSKDAPLGKLQFKIALSPRSLGPWTQGLIRQVSGTGDTMSGASSIAPDGMAALLAYSSPGGDEPGVQVELSGPAQVRIEGNDGLQPIVIEVP